MLWVALVEESILIFLDQIQMLKSAPLLLNELLEARVHFYFELRVRGPNEDAVEVFEQGQDAFYLVLRVVELVLFEEPDHCLFNDLGYYQMISIKHMLYVFFVESQISVINSQIHQAGQYFYVELHFIWYFVLEYLEDCLLVVVVETVLDQVALSGQFLELQ